MTCSTHPPFSCSHYNPYLLPCPSHPLYVFPNRSSHLFLFAHIICTLTPHSHTLHFSPFLLLFVNLLPPHPFYSPHPLQAEKHNCTVGMQFPSLWFPPGLKRCRYMCQEKNNTLLFEVRWKVNVWIINRKGTFLEEADAFCLRLVKVMFLTKAVKYTFHTITFYAAFLCVKSIFRSFEC